MRNALFAVAALAALAACDRQDAPSVPAGEAPAAADQAPVILGTTRNMPDWLLVAYQRDCPADATGASACPRGEVKFNQRTITRSADGFADIWVQVRHGAPQLYEVETDTRRTTIRFDMQRLHYRFNCNTQQFVVVERQIMGENETVVARDHPRQIWRAPAPRSATHLVMPIACRGS